MKFPTERPLDDTDEDLFGYFNLATRLIKKVFLEMETPNVFGLYGNWGAGKSTLLHCIESRIEESFSDEIKVIKFDAWQYEYADDKDLLYALINKVGVGLNATSAWKNLLTIAATIGYSVAAKISIGNDIAKIGVPSPKELKDNYDVIEKEVYKDHERWIDKTLELQNEFGKQIKESLEKSGHKKLIIIIDDLDRCLPENAIKLLEAVKNYLSVENVLFILAIDRRIITDMVEKKYQLKNGFGEEYLAKIIHYHYELPKVHLATVADIFFSRHELNASYKQKQFIISLLHDTAKEPRVAKFFLNQFFISLALSDSAQDILEKSTSDAELEYLFLASFLMTKYPRIFLTGDPAIPLRSIRASASATQNPDVKDGRDRAMSIFPIQQSDRKELESILSRNIHNKKETGPIDLNLLASTIIKLRQGNYEYMMLRPSDIEPSS